MINIYAILAFVSDSADTIPLWNCISWITDESYYSIDVYHLASENFKFLQKLLQFRGKPQRIPYNTIKAAAGGKPAATLIV